MKNYFPLLIVSILLLVGCSDKRSNSPRILVFTKTAGFVHNSIEDGVKAIEILGNENDFQVESSDDPSNFNDDYLAQFSAIIFLNTTGNILDVNQEAAFERYIQAGGGFVGVHSATDTEYDWFWYAKLVGAQFLGHPHIQEADFHITDNTSVATDFFEEAIWTRTDEIYNFKHMNPVVNVLVKVDENSYEGGGNGDNHPISWQHEYDGGRAFYTALGHTKESYTEPLYLKHLLGGIDYAIGGNKNLDYSKVKTQYPPDPIRFEKKSLSQGQFFEPTEMTILPNYDVLIGQRRGEILHYNSESKEVTQVAKLDVYHKTNVSGVNAEEGLMGLQKDPNYAENNWVYIYYAPTGDEWINRLSRFTFKDGVFDLSSEVKILDVHSQRDICCHTGGSIAFGGDGLLYLSTGDNATPFNDPEYKYVLEGYAPINDVPGKKQYDASRSSGNTNDLRGKIIRIKVNDDGTYDIPEGNLFPVGMEKTRPEIYTMGHRNPYRISVDQKNGYLYWGEVGPDAGQDNPLKGPKGHDEVGQAREAGNFGWPFFVGDNKAYNNYNYETGESREFFDPEKPINNSRNNTGLKELPPAKAAFIWYPYGKSQEFPQVGTGGRNAMAGPVYYNDMYPKETSLPEYYNGKLIIYEWMRGWIKAVSLFENGDFNKMEPFAPNFKLNNLIDMEVAPDGKIYLLEYGTGWFQHNDDSGLSVIEYNGGNLSPIVTNLSIDKTSGMTPLDVSLSVSASDLESSQLTYIWDLGNGEIKETNKSTLDYTYMQGGDYIVQVEVKDEEGFGTNSKLINVVAGNGEPKVSIEILNDNKSFFAVGEPINYKVTVEDPQSSSPVDLSNVYVSVDYLEGMDQANMDMGHKQVAAAVMGKSLTQSMDCRACHKEDGESIGPSYLRVSERYKDDPNAEKYLGDKIKAGGGGVWGETVMAAHPNISNEEVRQILEYIFSLTQEKQNSNTLPVEGVIVPDQHSQGKSMIITASYTDSGEEGVKALTGTTTRVLKNRSVRFSNSTEVDGFSKYTDEGTTYLVFPQTEGWFSLKNIDLSSIKTATIMAGWDNELPFDLNFEIHLNAPGGPSIGKGVLKRSKGQQMPGFIPITLEEIKEERLYDLYFTYNPANPDIQISGALINVNFN